MKSLLKIAALAALLLPLSCNNKTQPEDKGETLPPSTLTKPAEADHACVITVPKDEAPLVELRDEAYGILLRWINAPSGRYIAEFELVEDKATKGDAKIERLTGTYKYENGEYKCSGDFEGSIKFENNQLTVSPEDEEPVTVPATQTPTQPTTENESNACRTWTITKIDLNLDKPAISHPFPDNTYKANSPKDIATYLKNHDVKVDPSKLEGYDIQEITLYPAPANQVQVNFSGKDSYFGSFTISGNTLNYDLREFIKQDLFSGTANCELTFTGNNCLAKVTVKTESLSGSATITLSEKK